MKCIGKGAFTKAYLNQGSVILESCDPIKECMAMGWFPNSRLFPKIERTEYGEISTYKMKYYPKVKSLKKTLKPKEYNKYKMLKEAMYNIPITMNKFNGSENIYIAFKGIKDKYLRQIMIDALDACGNYGSDVGFEISPRNVAVNNGNLVLLDCFFMKSKLEEVRSKKC